MSKRPWFVNVIFWGLIIFWGVLIILIVVRARTNERPEVIERHRQEAIKAILEVNRLIELNEKKQAASSCAEFAGSADRWLYQEGKAADGSQSLKLTSAFDECFQRELANIKIRDAREEELADQDEQRRMNE